MHYDDATLLLLRPAAVARLVEPTEVVDSGQWSVASGRSSAESPLLPRDHRPLSTPHVPPADTVPPPQSASPAESSPPPEPHLPPAPSPASPGTASAPAAQPPVVEPGVQNWTDNVVSLSENVAGRISDSMLRGLRKFKAAVRKCQDKLPPGDEPPAAK